MTTDRPCQHRSYTVIGKDGAFRVRCSTCGSVTARARETIAEAYRRRREDWEAAAAKAEEEGNHERA